MAKRKKKHQKERVLEPLVEPGQPIKVPDEAPAMTPLRVAAHAKARRHLLTPLKRAKERRFVVTNP